MKLSALSALASVLVAANAIQVWKRPTVEDAAVNARTLIQRESLANINTVYQDGDDKGLPASFVEYYTDCGDGNPVILAIDMATSFKNINGGSPYSLTVRVGDHAPHEQVDPRYPGSRPHSVAGSPRINLRGKLEAVKEEDVDELQKCFLKRHKDAAWWLPGNPIHASHFVKFMVDEAYFLGGFGDTGYIGKIPKELYHNSSSIDQGRPKDHHDDKEEFVKELSEGDGSNWGYDAYMLHHSLKSSMRSTFKKIDGEIKALKELLKEGENEVKEGQAYAGEEQLKEFIKSSKNKFSKRNEEQVPLTVPDVNLSSEQINKLIEELEQLKSDFLQFGKKVLQKTTGDENVKDFKIEEIDNEEEKDEPKKQYRPKHKGMKHARTKCHGEEKLSRFDHKGRVGKHHRKFDSKRHHDRRPESLLTKVFNFITGFGGPEGPGGPGPRPHHPRPHHFRPQHHGEYPDEFDEVHDEEFRHGKPPGRFHHKFEEEFEEEDFKHHGPRPGKFDHEEEESNERDFRQGRKHHGPRPGKFEHDDREATHKQDFKMGKHHGGRPAKNDHKGEEFNEKDVKQSKHHEERPAKPEHKGKGFKEPKHHGKGKPEHRVNEDDFKQRRPKNVKFDSDFKGEKRSPKNIRLGVEKLDLN